MKTAILTDSTAYISKELRKQHGIYMVPLSVVIGGETYREEMDITANEFFEKIKEESDLPTTSQPAIGEFVELFTEISKSHDAVICIHLSSGISGTYQGAITASTMVDELEVYAFDTEISCLPQGLYAIEAAKMAKEGHQPLEILARLDEMKTVSDAYFVVDDLRHLQRGGRLSSAQAIIGSLLQIKPLLTFENKVIIPFEKIRTKKKALKRVEELFDQAAQKGTPLQVAIIHANREEEALDWKNDLSTRYPDVEFSISYFGPVIGTHIGEGSLGMGWTKKYAKVPSKV
jgi:DegV family protein with EDD domain